jgi:hypothetical protein
MSTTLEAPVRTPARVKRPAAVIPPPSAQTASVAAPAIVERRARFALPAALRLEQLFVWFGFAIAFCLTAAFGLDLAFGWPFLRASVLFDVACVVCGLGLAYLSWNTQRDLLR